MTLHIRAVHASTYERADVLARRKTCEACTEQLRSEIEQERPMLTWPVRSQEFRQAI